MEMLKQGLLQLFEKVRPNLGFYAAVIVSVSSHLIFVDAFRCPCDHTHWFCWAHMFLPVVIIWILLLWMEIGLPSVKKCTCFLFTRILHAFCVGPIWIAVVLIQGDWFVCCHDIFGIHITQMPACEFINSQTEKENCDVSNLKSLSKAVGLGVVLGIAVFGCIVSCIRMLTTKLNERVLEDGSELVFSLLNEQAKEKLRADVQTYINQEEWWKCSGAVKELMQKMEAPRQSPAN